MLTPVSLARLHSPTSSLLSVADGRSQRHASVCAITEMLRAPESQDINQTLRSFTSLIACALPDPRHERLLVSQRMATSFHK